MSETEPGEDAGWAATDPVEGSQTSGVPASGLPVSGVQGAEGSGRRRWRRNNDKSGSRTHRLELKLTDEEYVRLSAESEVRRCSRQAVLMRALFADGTEAARRLREIEADLMSARRGVARVSGNLNQAVKLEHTRRLEGSTTGLQFEEQMAVVLAEVEAVMAEMRAVLERIDT